ncbi:hypothetical protein IGI04_013254 [Brassica rapa subsp. trilocularis]|uniref:Uncharacterized protein n=1 Tax=Brassica rapa subsp. trilocularis TaxID=1813537 RepID=A0ABQ7N8C9_BRACM|nr:hypothetical protein IGI04_013254 [Brassica rapa subsp. trilocularis]
MASSDVVLAHSAFDALRLGRSPQIIVGRDLNLQSPFTLSYMTMIFCRYRRQTLGPQAKKPSQITHPIHLYLSTLTITGESSGNIKVKTRVPPKPIARIPAASASSFEVFVDEEEESTEEVGETRKSETN